MKNDKLKPPLYLKVAQQLQGQIQQGAYRIGEQVPSVRELSRRHGVSVSTVLQAYFWLENKGCIEARPKSGFYVRMPEANLHPVPSFRPVQSKPTPVTTSEIVADLLHPARGRIKVSFGAAFPEPDRMPAHQLNSIIRRISRQSPALSVSHEHSPGSLRLRQQVAKRSGAFGCNFLPEDLIITNGAVEGLNLCLRAVARPGDVIATESPTYFNVLQSIESLGMRAVEIPADSRTGLDLNVLEHALKNYRVRAYIAITNCHNPLGYVLPDEKKRALVDLLGSHNVPLIEDDVYGDLAFSPQRPRLAKTFDRSGLVLVCGSVSKTISPGLRIGWVHTERYQAQIAHLKLITSIGCPALSEAVVAEFLESGGYDRHLRHIRQFFETQVATFSQAISKYFPEGTKLSRPAGGYVLWIELPRQVDSVELYHAAMKEGISISPGPIFSASGKFRNYIRLNCGLKWSGEIDRAVLKLGRLCEVLL